jgi:hypothetical protein
MPPLPAGGARDDVAAGQNGGGQVRRPQPRNCAEYSAPTRRRPVRKPERRRPVTTPRTDGPATATPGPDRDLMPAPWPNETSRRSPGGMESDRAWRGQSLQAVSYQRSTEGSVESGGHVLVHAGDGALQVGERAAGQPELRRRGWSRCAAARRRRGAAGPAASSTPAASGGGGRSGALHQEPLRRAEPMARRLPVGEFTSTALEPNTKQSRSPLRGQPRLPAGASGTGVQLPNTGGGPLHQQKFSSRKDECWPERRIHKVELSNGWLSPAGSKPSPHGVSSVGRRVIASSKR